MPSLLQQPQVLPYISEQHLSNILVVEELLSKGFCEEYASPICMAWLGLSQKTTW